ncbi:hypothetical protein Cme02nite_19450 [Catellatospora methionotrophica]|uniref:Uncharacterized protein n=1 Tax=Catellatospora methionotrophica TaxID=121620 RepID=A0A8J3L3D1_9ACTN|nr:hypothetical protein Cme02nite_19450 [Catellatospora methionotrophica]
MAYARKRRTADVALTTSAAVPLPAGPKFPPQRHFLQTRRDRCARGGGVLAGRVGPGRREDGPDPEHPRGCGTVPGSGQLNGGYAFAISCWN